MEKSDNYTWKILEDFPAKKPIRKFPHDSPYYEEKFFVEVIPENGNSWVGNFIGIHNSQDGKITKSPMPGVIFVGGWETGYFVDVYNPTKYEKFPSVGIEKIFNIPEKKLMIIQGIIDVSAFNENGLLWITEQFGHGENIIQEITENEVLGGTWIPWENQYSEFRVNLKTGKLSIPDSARSDFLDNL